MPVEQSVVGRKRLCITGRSAEPVVSAETVIKAIEPCDIEAFRPLLPVGYLAGVRAYQFATEQLTALDLTTHYTAGLDFFHDVFVPQLKTRIQYLSGNVFELSEYVAFAAGSDVDLMAHLINSVAVRERVCLYPGDWHGFRVGCIPGLQIDWDSSGKGGLACLCIPSVRNGHVTKEMLGFLDNADACLLNLNLYPTLSPLDRESCARDLLPLLPKSVLSISFSRGFGLTASQLGVMLVPKSHPYIGRFQEQLNWFTYFYNGLAARAFLNFDLDAAQDVDRLRSQWVRAWLEERGMPVVDSGSYYVRSFEVLGPLPDYFAPLMRDNIIRLCFKPPQT